MQLAEEAHTGKMKNFVGWMEKMRAVNGSVYNLRVSQCAKVCYVSGEHVSHTLGGTSVSLETEIHKHVI